MDVPILTVNDVHKAFATVQAVRGVSFDVRRGEVFALLGPNGAGKTTLTRMILSIIRPDRGDIAFNVDGSSNNTIERSQTGYLPEDRGLFRDIPVMQTLIYFGRLRGLLAADARQRAQRWLERFELGDRANERLEALSRGNQQKVQFISAVLHEPPLAVLDEPFSGFDPVNQQRLLDLFLELRDGGMTILLSAHHMELVERVADRVLLISQGRRLLYGALDELHRHDGAEMKLVIEHAGPCDEDALSAHPGVVSIERMAPDRITLRAQSQSVLSEVLKLLGGTLDVRSIHAERQTLHDIYVHAVDAVEPPSDPAADTQESPT